jgi:23S rRNA pseudouridine955/2504/2580 synthase
MNELGKDRVNTVLLNDNADGQRIDNYLLKILKGVPKSHIYRILRSGEVRLNGGRVGPSARLSPGDKLRIPPIRTATRDPVSRADSSVKLTILYEDDDLIAIDKPSGLAVHGGSGVSSGVIELIRGQRPKAPFLELVHRIDKETSGILLIAKKRSALKSLHEQIREGTTRKVYWAIVAGQFERKSARLNHPLRKFVTKAGERRVVVDRVDGKASLTIVKPIEVLGDFSLLEADIKTGRTHQIRVHLSHELYPILGDEKYGDFAKNKQINKSGLKRMFLHAREFSFEHPVSGDALTIVSDLPSELSEFLKTARRGIFKVH